MQLYAIFHLNLLYSSIEEEQRVEVLRRCYWPLLRLAQDLNLPIGIEASGLTLEIAEALDPAWVQTLRHLVTEGSCEWLGSGYTQLIGPLVPAQVNAKNLQLGHEVYERLLGLRPKVAFVNEQAYSAGLVQHYLNAGYQAIVMEWENPAHNHPEWDPAWQYLPQRACGLDGESIPIIWNTSLSFQKFQRYAHGEMNLPHYIEYVAQHRSDSVRAFSVYGNDAEVFGFRPGRYETEAPLHPEGEWTRIQEAFRTIHADPRFEFVTPSQVLNLESLPGAGHYLTLESVSSPVPVKKQAKYNLLRWAVTGRDDSQINARCWQIYEWLQGKDSVTPQAWRELCYLWSSDFRTHISPKRWQAFQSQLETVQQAFVDKATQSHKKKEAIPTRRSLSKQWVTHRDRTMVTVETDCVKLRVNCLKGLAIDGLWIKQVSDFPLIGTLPHGLYHDISMGADYFSGHLVFESPVQPKVTDLSPVEPIVESMDGNAVVKISGGIATKFGMIRKELVIAGDGQVTLRYDLDWRDVPPGVLRLGHVTLHPSAYDVEDLIFETHNGGYSPETFPLKDCSVDHGRPVSFLVSANNGFGYTEGSLVFRDTRTSIRVQSRQSQGYVIPLLSVHPVSPSYFCRISFSAMEFDDTTRDPVARTRREVYEFMLSAKRETPSRVLQDQQEGIVSAVSC